MYGDLTKPLGLPRRDAPARSWRRVAVAAALAVCTVVGIGGWALFLLRPSVPAPGPVISSVETLKSDEKSDGKSNERAQDGAKSADPVRTGVIRRLEVDGRAQADAQSQAGQAGLETLQPDGAIVAKLPSPKPRRQEIALAHLPDPALSEKVDDGILPKRGADGQRPLDVYSRQPATEGNFGVARVVLIVGGMGISQTGSQQAVRKLPGAVNLAFAPYGNSLSRWMQEARRSGHEILLQVPMQPYDWPSNDPGPNTLLADAEPQANLANLHWAMTRITNYVGVVNFLGGKLLSQEPALAPIFDDLAKRGLLFVDDGSMANSRSAEAASAARLPFARADIQIDAVRTRREIAARLDQLVTQARRTGLAVGMANAFPETIEMLAQFAAGAEKLGIEITPVSAIVSDPEREKKG